MPVCTIEISLVIAALETDTRRTEYRVRELSQQERDAHAADYGQRELLGYDRTFALERRHIRQKKTYDWDVLDWSDTFIGAAFCCSESDYLTAQSLHQTHSHAVETMKAMVTVQLEIDALTRKMTGLAPHYKELFVQRLKEERLHKAYTEGRADKERVGAIMAQLEQAYEEEKAQLSAELDSLQQRHLSTLEKYP